MNRIDRRRFLEGSAGVAAAATGLWAPAVHAQASPNFKPEKGAKLRVLRWSRFVQGDIDAYMVNVRKFTEKTGIEVRVDNEGWEDVRPKAAVAANTGAGPDIILSTNDDANLYPDKLLDVTDVAEYIGKKYGGWYPAGQAFLRPDGKKWIGIPLGAAGSMMVYRDSVLKSAGFDSFPKDTDGFLKMMKAVKDKGMPGGMALGNATGDGLWCNWLIWSHGGMLVDKNNKVIVNSPETAKALEYVKSLYENFIPGTASWNDSSNNKAFLAGQLHLTTNGISIYVAAKKENPAIAADMDHAHLPVGISGQVREQHLGFPILIFNFSKYPQACKAFTAFLMEGPQFNPWIEAAQGYLSHFLLAYDANPIWTADPKNTPYRDVAKLASTPAGIGTLNESAAAAIADFVVVDMFANYCTGREDLKGAMASAERQFKRIYRS